MSIKSLASRFRLPSMVLPLFALFFFSSIASAQLDNNSYIVQAGDKFAGVATKFQPPGMALKDVMDSIYSMNQDAFINVNGDPRTLIVGRILRIPSQLTKKESSANSAQSDDADFTLSGGDKINIQVFENPDLTLNTQVSQSGIILFPLIGEVKVGGLSADKAAQVISNRLRQGGFVQEPHVTVTITEIVGSAITVLGYVNKPGVYTLTKRKISIGEALGLVGGIIVGTQNQNNTQNIASGSNTIILSGVRNEIPFKEVINLESGVPPQNSFLYSGDILYIPPAPTFYIYGQVTNPGMRKIESNMTVVQALASAGGLTLRGTQRNIKVFRKNTEGAVVKSTIDLVDLIQAGDVLFVEESLF